MLAEQCCLQSLLSTEDIIGKIISKEMAYLFFSPLSHESFFYSMEEQNVPKRFLISCLIWIVQ